MDDQAMPELLRQFIVEDCDSDWRERLLREIESPSGAIREFFFNRFNITIDHEAGQVRVEDDLDAGPTGELRLSPTAFAAALKAARR